MKRVRHLLLYGQPICGMPLSDNHTTHSFCKSCLHIARLEHRYDLLKLVNQEKRKLLREQAWVHRTLQAL